VPVTLYAIAAVVGRAAGAADAVGLGVEGVDAAGGELDGGLGVGNGRGVAPVDAHAPDKIARAITNA
jgi:hypothetical protein